jgi:hypothetical protein
VSELSEDERARLARVAAVLLPGGDTPAALALTPALAEAVRRALHALQDADLEAVLADGGPDVAALLLVVTAEHYADPAVRQAIGYPGPQPLPLPPLPDAADAGLDELLDRVRARGPIYRDA